MNNLFNQKILAKKAEEEAKLEALKVLEKKRKTN